MASAESMRLQAQFMAPIEKIGNVTPAIFSLMDNAVSLYQEKAGGQEDPHNPYLVFHAVYEAVGTLKESLPMHDIFIRVMEQTQVVPYQIQSGLLVAADELGWDEYQQTIVSFIGEKEVYTHYPHLQEQDVLKLQNA